MGDIELEPITTDQRNKAVKLFDCFRGKKDYLEISDLQPMLASLQMTVDPQSLAIVFQKFDTNKSGRLAIEQFGHMLHFLVDMKKTALSECPNKKVKRTKLTAKVGKPVVVKAVSFWNYKLSSNNLIQKFGRPPSRKMRKNSRLNMTTSTEAQRRSSVGVRKSNIFTSSTNEQQVLASSSERDPKPLCVSNEQNLKLGASNMSSQSSPPDSNILLESTPISVSVNPPIIISEDNNNKPNISDSNDFESKPIRTSGLTSSGAPSLLASKAPSTNQMPPFPRRLKRSLPPSKLSIITKADEIPVAKHPSMEKLPKVPSNQVPKTSLTTDKKSSSKNPIPSALSGSSSGSVSKMPSKSDVATRSTDLASSSGPSDKTSRKKARSKSEPVRPVNMGDNTALPKEQKVKPSLLKKLKSALLNNHKRVTSLFKEKREAIFLPRDRSLPAELDGIFIDDSFPRDDSLLPLKAKSSVYKWRRPQEMCENPQLFVDGIGEGDVRQGSLADCWFVGALAILASGSSKSFIQKSFVKSDMARGEFTCRFYKHGEWVNVTVDSFLPCGNDGKLYFASCVDSNEWWVPIIEKAYAKLHGGYAAIEYGSIADALKDMSGEAVEILNCDKREIKSNLWQTLMHHHKESYLMGCAIENNDVKPEQEDELGLLANHAYSILDVLEVHGHRLIKIRNPWGRVEWQGPWSDESKEWTPEMLEATKHTFGNDGTFFMAFEDFATHFNRIHVLIMLRDNEGEVWYKTPKRGGPLRGEWKGPSAAGCGHFPINQHIVNNPQYAITSKHRNQVIVCLSQPDLRYTEKRNLADGGLEYNAMGMWVMKTVGELTQKVDDLNCVETQPAFSGQRDITVNFEILPGRTYVIIPCTFQEKVESPFEIVIYSRHLIEVERLH